MDELTERISQQPGRLPAPGRLLLAVTTLVTVASAGTAADAATTWTVHVAAASAGQARGGTLAAPTGVGAVCATNKVPVVVTWNAVANATGYTVSEATAPAGPYTSLATGVTGTAASVTPSPAGTYYLAVTATRSNWSGPTSPTASTRTTYGNGNCQ